MFSSVCACCRNLSVYHSNIIISCHALMYISLKITRLSSHHFIQPCQFECFINYMKGAYASQNSITSADTVPNYEAFVSTTVLPAKEVV